MSEDTLRERIAEMLQVYAVSGERAVDVADRILALVRPAEPEREPGYLHEASFRTGYAAGYHDGASGNPETADVWLEELAEDAAAEASTAQEGE